jgi:hypothetical protein
MRDSGWRSEYIVDSGYSPIAVARRSEAFGSAARMLGLRMRMPPRREGGGGHGFVSCESSVLSALCDGLITRPEEHRMWCDCSHEASIVETLAPTRGSLRRKRTR